MCSFCEHILVGILHVGDLVDDVIVYDPETEEFDIEIPDVDPYCGGILENVKFCPYCGEKLDKRKGELK